MIPKLEEVEVAFLNWRSTKKSLNEKIPKNLLEQARLLLAEHKAMVICERLKLQHRKLVGKRVKKETPVDDKSSQFIELPQIKIQKSQKKFDQPIIIEVRHPRHKDFKITIPLPVNLEELFSGLSKILVV